MDRCPNCGKILIEDEKIICKCTACGERFANRISKDNSEYELHKTIKQMAQDVRFFKNLFIVFIVISIIFAIIAIFV